MDDKENFQRQSQVRSANQARHALGAITSNIPIKINPSQNKVKVRVHVDVKITKDRGENDNDVFVDGKDHFVNWKEEPDKYGKKYLLPTVQPVQEVVEKKTLPVPVVRRSIRSKSDSQLRVKEKLVRRISNRACGCPGNRSARNAKQTFTMFLYNSEYFKENYDYFLKIEIRWILRKDFLRRFNPDQVLRMQVVDWLLYVQQHFQLLESTLFTAVRLFDFVLASVHVDSSMYSLAAIVALWITNKNYESSHIYLSKLLTICNGQYSKNKFKEMELMILKMMNFNVNIPEPLEFVNYFLKKLQVSYTQNIPLAVNFILECVSLFPKFSSSPPTILAVAAIYLAFKNVGEEAFSEKHFLECVYELYPISSFENLLPKIDNMIKIVMEKDFQFQEVIKKYSSDNKKNIVRFFLSKI